MTRLWLETKVRPIFVIEALSQRVVVRATTSPRDELELPILLAGSVRGYTTKRGTYVAPHQRSTPNKGKPDNDATKNPYTDKKGTK